MADNYVKFRRGTPAAYKALCQTLDGPNKDTLYFIYEEDEAKGELYLGSKLIAGSSGDVISATTLAKLSDVLLNADLNDKDALVYDINQLKWVNKPITDVLSAFVGTNGVAKGAKGLVPAPLASEANMFLRSDGHWAEIVVASETQVFQTVVGDNEDIDIAISRIVGDATLSKGDVVVLKEAIANEKYQYTSYIYDGVNWVAMDGNYDAENVYLANNLIITADIGVQTLDGAGFKELSTAGKNLKQVFDMLLAARKLPGYTKPSVSVSCENAKSYEVGTVIDLNYSATFNDGKYDYAPGEDTGVQVSLWKATFDGQENEGSSGEFNNIVVTDNYKKRIVVTATHSAGVAPVDNFGNLVTEDQELAECQIPSGTKTGYSNYVTGYRNMFFGSKTSAMELESDNIRALSAQSAAAGSIDVSVVDNATQVIIAVPSEYTVVKVADNNAFGTDIVEKFDVSVVSVAGATEGYDKNYNVYTYNPSVALGENIYTVTIQ